jgi:hypothetical protein
MALDDSPTGNNQPGWVEIEAGDRRCGFANQHPLVAASCAGNVAKPFDRMHPRQPSCAGRGVLR